MPIDPKTKVRAYVVGLFRPDREEDKKQEDYRGTRRGFYPFATNWGKNIPPGNGERPKMPTDQMPWHYAKDGGAHAPTFKEFCERLDPMHPDVEAGTLDEKNLFVRHGFGVLAEDGDPKYSAFKAAPGKAIAQRLTEHQDTLKKFYETLHSLVNDFADSDAGGRRNNADLGRDFYPTLLREILSGADCKILSGETSDGNGDALLAELSVWADSNESASERIKKTFESFRDVRRICGSGVMLNMMLNWPLLYVVQEAEKIIGNQQFQNNPHTDKEAVITAYAALANKKFEDVATTEGLRRRQDILEPACEALKKKLQVQRAKPRLTLAQIREVCARHEAGYVAFLQANDEIERASELDNWIAKLPNTAMLDEASRAKLLAAGKDFAERIGSDAAKRSTEAKRAAKAIVSKYVRVVLGFSVYDRATIADEFLMLLLELHSECEQARVGGADDALKRLGKKHRDDKSIQHEIGAFDTGHSKIELKLMENAAEAITTFANRELSADQIEAKEILSDAVRLYTDGIQVLIEEGKFDAIAAGAARPNLEESGSHSVTFYDSHPLTEILRKGFERLPDTLVEEVMATLKEEAKQEKTKHKEAKVAAAARASAGAGTTRESAQNSPPPAPENNPEPQTRAAGESGPPPEKVDEAEDEKRKADLRKRTQGFVGEAAASGKFDIRSLRRKVEETARGYGQELPTETPAPAVKSAPPAAPTPPTSSLKLDVYAESFVNAWQKVLRHTNSDKAEADFGTRTQSLLFLDSLLLLGRNAGLTADVRSNLLQLAKDLIGAGTVEKFLKTCNPLDYLPMVESADSFDSLVRLLLKQEENSLGSLRLLVSELAGVKVLFDSVQGTDAEIIVFNGTAEEFVREVGTNLIRGGVAGANSYLIPGGTSLTKQAIPGVIYVSNLAFVDVQETNTFVKEIDRLRVKFTPEAVEMLDNLVKISSKASGYNEKKKSGFIKDWAALSREATQNSKARQTVMAPCILTLGQEEGADQTATAWVTEDFKSQKQDALLKQASIHLIGPSIFLREGVTNAYATNAAEKEIFVTTLPAGYPLLAYFLSRKIAHADRLQYNNVQFFGEPPLGTFVLARTVSQTVNIDELIATQIGPLPTLPWPNKSDGSPEKGSPRLELSYHVFATLLAGAESGVSPDKWVTTNTIVFSNVPRTAEDWRKARLRDLVKPGSGFEKWWLAANAYPAKPSQPVQWQDGPLSPELEWIHFIL